MRPKKVWKQRYGVDLEFTERSSPLMNSQNKGSHGNPKRGNVDDHDKMVAQSNSGSVFLALSLTLTNNLAEILMETETHAL